MSRKIKIVQSCRMQWTVNLERLVNVGIVETGYFIFVTRYRFLAMQFVPESSISLM